jgi:hypothetical protein
MDLTLLITVSAIVLAHIGTTITMFMWATTHAKQDTANIQRILERMDKEQRDFHARLANQDLEFKQHMQYLHYKKLEE